ncbi:PaaI family thioesterase [Sandaracinus amylolyticus]|uniref:ComA operon protein 2 n=1 Tax=Sandaracinus amylolyticus TaxID=927083 RepID=A0A0F6W9N9_9BACT|nr:PaaI family thioesterase [Sandaracinus amylolyticus]AKF11006.1 ComA operon protein 2 [Sandaracinus amylolyticus]
MGLRFVRASRDEVIAELEIGEVHRQPYGLVHGGVYAGIVEAVTSVGAALDARAHGRGAVGLENHTTFLRAARDGVLRVVARPLVRGRRTQVWEATVRDAEGRELASGRVRLLVIEPDVPIAGEAISVDGKEGA